MIKTSVTKTKSCATIYIWQSYTSMYLNSLRFFTDMY